MDPGMNLQVLDAAKVAALNFRRILIECHGNWPGLKTSILRLYALLMVGRSPGHTLGDGSVSIPPSLKKKCRASSKVSQESKENRQVGIHYNMLI